MELAYFNKIPTTIVIKGSLKLAIRNENFDNCVRKFQKITSTTFHRKTYFA